MKTEFVFEGKKYSLELYVRSDDTIAVAIDIWTQNSETGKFEYYQTSWRALKNNYIEYDKYDHFMYSDDLRNIFDRYVKNKAFW